MSVTIEDKIDDIKMLAKIDSSNPKFSDARIIRQLSIAERRFAKEVKMLCRKWLTQDIVSGQAAYPIVGTGSAYRAPAAVLECWYKDGTNDRLLPGKNTRQELSVTTNQTRTTGSVFGFQKVTDAGSPSFFYLQQDSSEWKVYLWPVPNVALTNGLEIISSFVPGAITDATGSSELPDEYAYIPDFMAASILSAANGEWGIARTMKEMYMSEVERVRTELADRDYVDTAIYPEDDQEYGLLGENIWNR